MAPGDRGAPGAGLDADPQHDRRQGPLGSPRRRTGHRPWPPTVWPCPKRPARAATRRSQRQPRYPSLEEEILAFWREDRTFEASVELHGTETEYVFYDGPPFANGLPHYGHLLTGFVKDAVPRYQTMRGHRVERRFGWDCHGLPAEMEAEKELGSPAARR